MIETLTAPEKKLGEYRPLTRCRLCGSKDLSKFIDFGLFPLAGAFLKSDQVSEERYYPMAMQFCRTCSNVQVDTAVSGDTLFRNYFYFSSAINTLKGHFTQLAAEIAERFAPPGKGFVVEIGANDGVLQRPLVAKGVRSLGVDPASNVVASIKDNIQVLDAFFTEKVGKKIRQEHGAADLIASSFSFAHIDDMHDVMRGVDFLLAEDGVLLFEVYYLGIVIEEMQYDMMYHEHMSYYTLHALEKFLGQYGMEVFGVRRMPLRSGTLRFYAQRRGKGKHPIDPSVATHRAQEKKQGLLDEKTYLSWGAKVNKTKTDLLQVLNDLKAKGKQVIGYGASGRATTIMNYCGIDTKYLDYVVDDAPAKHGYLTPGTHVTIKPWSEVEAGRQPDYALVFAWPFLEEVKKRRKPYLDKGGKFIVPLPNVHILGS